MQCWGYIESHTCNTVQTDVVQYTYMYIGVSNNVIEFQVLFIAICTSAH